MNFSVRTAFVLGIILIGLRAYAAEGDRTCLMCHNITNWPQVHEIFATPHGTTTDARTPEATEGCASCHGDGSEHRKQSKSVPPEVSFGPRHSSPSEVQSEACLGCHRSTARHWDSSSHALEDLSCAACHSIHTTETQALQRISEAGVCLECHRDVKAQLNLPSRHPIREAKTICTDCHTPHGSLKPFDLIEASLTETCLGCHEELRGPFLFDHPPAADDCSTCHVPHGAVHEPLLVARPAQLCQECHLAAFHPSDLNAGGGLPGGVPNSSLLGRNCLNCHPRIHGTNHPSGARLTR